MGKMIMILMNKEGNRQDVQKQGPQTGANSHLEVCLKTIGKNSEANNLYTLHREENWKMIKKCKTEE